MNTWSKRSILLFAASMLLARGIPAESKNPADYPLRIHILSRNETNFYHHRSLDETSGQGRANLFAEGTVHGVDFSFECSEKLPSSVGFETYAAKWKKPNQDLVVLLPVFGKTGAYVTCDLKTDVKTIAYTSHNGQIGEESPEAFKTWMVKHNYDPEHGKDIPTTLSGSAEPVAPAAPKSE